MSPARSDDPLRRVNLYLYEDDVAFCTKHFGGGWQRQIREIVHSKVKDLRRTAPLTIADIFGEPK